MPGVSAQLQRVYYLDDSTSGFVICNMYLFFGLVLLSICTMKKKDELVSEVEGGLGARAKRKDKGFQIQS